MSKGAKHFPQRDYRGRCVECGHHHATRRPKRLEVVAMAIAGGAEDRYNNANTCYDDWQMACRYRAVILPRSLRVQVLTPMPPDLANVGRTKDRWYWRDVQKIPREQQASYKLPLWTTFSEFERAIVTGALARRLRDAAREADERMRQWRLNPDPGTPLEPVRLCHINDLVERKPYKPRLSWWSRLFTFTPWLAVMEPHQ